MKVVSTGMENARLIDPLQIKSRLMKLLFSHCEQTSETQSSAHQTLIVEFILISFDFCPCAMPAV